MIFASSFFLPSYQISILLLAREIKPPAFSRIDNRNSNILLLDEWMMIVLMHGNMTSDKNIAEAFA
jgi:hypothetical protein